MNKMSQHVCVHMTFLYENFIFHLYHFFVCIYLHVSCVTVCLCYKSYDNFVPLQLTLFKRHEFDFDK